MAEAAVFEEEGWRAALDCDVIFSCVDRPWGRHALNVMAYAHLIPVVDGGIAVRTNKHGRLAAADWRAHVVAPGRPCLECLGQYDPADVAVEQQGLLDLPSYILGLDPSHVLRTGQNVSVFSMAAASMQVLQMIALVVAPLGRGAPKRGLYYHFVGNVLDAYPAEACSPECLFPTIVANGDRCPFVVTGVRCVPAPEDVTEGEP